VRLDPAGRAHARRAGFDWKLGDIVDDAALDKVAEVMAETLMKALNRLSVARRCRRALSDGSALRSLRHRRRDVLRRRCRIYLRPRGARFRRYGAAPGPGDPGEARQGALPWPLLPAGECIRATALGASEYSVQLSGNTSYISDPGKLLPRRNLQVLLPALVFGEVVDPGGGGAGHRCASQSLRGRSCRRGDRARLPLDRRTLL